MKAKKCSIRNLVVVISREVVRARYSRKADIPHGVILTISKDAERSSLGRRKTNRKAPFDFKRYVKGWKSLKHIRYCSDRSYKIPSIPELENSGASSLEREKDAAEVSDGSLPELSDSDGIGHLAAIFQRKKRLVQSNQTSGGTEMAC